MKKFLLLMLVLGLATSAQAGLIFTVDGIAQPDEIGVPGDQWYPILPSDIIELDLEVDAEQSIFAFTIDYVLSNAQARFITDGASGQYPDLPDMTDIEFPMVFELPSEVNTDLPQLVQITGSQLFGDPIPGPGVIMRELYVHCLDTTDVILEIISQGVELYRDGVKEFIPAGTVMHTLTIHQIPEPMTIALLGLGGLFALRKRK